MEFHDRNRETTSLRKSYFKEDGDFKKGFKPNNMTLKPEPQQKNYKWKYDHAHAIDRSA